MIIRLFSLALASMVLLQAPVFAHNHSSEAQSSEERLCEFAPENDLQIPAGLEFSNATMDEATFNSIISRVEKIYAPIVKSKGGKLEIKRLWSNATVNASATRMFKTWTVNMYGGLARHPEMTPDGFAMVVCHELGHHLGGFPRTGSIFGKWASNEGQSDYFAAMKCFRKVYESDDNIQLMSSISVPAKVTESCSKTWKSAKEIALCQRVALTGKTLATVLWTLGRQARGDGKPAREPAANPDFATPTSAQVASTDNAHPLAQCRLDTMFNGALCGMSHTEDFADKNAVGGACAEERGDKIGVRARCWYKPGSRAEE